MTFVKCQGSQDWNTYQHLLQFTIVFILVQQELVLTTGYFETITKTRVNCLASSKFSKSHLGLYCTRPFNYKMPDLFWWVFSLSRIFTDLIMHNYRSNQSALMTRCGTDFRHQYGIFSSKSQTSFTRNTIWARSKEGWLFSQATFPSSSSFFSFFYVLFQNTKIILYSTWWESQIHLHVQTILTRQKHNIPIYFKY